MPVPVCLPADVPNTLLSKDGIHWSEPPVVVLPPRKETAWEDDINRPIVLKRGNVYHMWYSGGEQYEPNAIGYATSPDGLEWTRQPDNPVFTGDPKISWEQNRVAGCQVIKQADGYVMFYIGYRDIDHAQIGVARSKDGNTRWQRHPANPIVRPGKESWDHDACYKPFAIYDGVRWLLWYNGRHGSLEQIGVVFHDGKDLGFGEWPR